MKYLMSMIVLFVAILIHPVNTYAAPVIEFTINNANCVGEVAVDEAGVETGEFLVSCEPPQPSCIITSIEPLDISGKPWFLYQFSVQDEINCPDGCEAPLLVPEGINATVPSGTVP